MFLTRFNMYSIILLLYDIINVSSQFSQNCFTKCNGFNTKYIGAY